MENFFLFVLFVSSYQNKKSTIVKDPTSILAEITVGVKSNCVVAFEIPVLLHFDLNLI